MFNRRPDAFPSVLDEGARPCETEIRLKPPSCGFSERPHTLGSEDTMHG